eukprot:scaffold3767_cov114-Isochrysis_galbana.AAC.32
MAKLRAVALHRGQVSSGQARDGDEEPRHSRGGRQVGRQVVCRLVLLPSPATVDGAENGPATTDGPCLIRVGDEDDVEDAIAARLDLQPVEWNVDELSVHACRGRGARDLAAGRRHPESVLKARLDEAHRGDAARRAAVVWDPKFIARPIGEVEVAARRHGKVGAAMVVGIAAAQGAGPRTRIGVTLGQAKGGAGCVVRCGAQCWGSLTHQCRAGCR